MRLLRIPNASFVRICRNETRWDVVNGGVCTELGIETFHPELTFILGGLIMKDSVTSGSWIKNSNSCHLCNTRDLGGIKWDIFWDLRDSGHGIVKRCQAYELAEMFDGSEEETVPVVSFHPEILDRKYIKRVAR
jgi:hypothetical protein